MPSTLELSTCYSFFLKKKVVCAQSRMCVYIYKYNEKKNIYLCVYLNILIYSIYSRI